MDLNPAQEAEFVRQIAYYQPALHAYIISLMPGLDGVDDVLQETNVVLWEKRNSFEPGSNFRAWACAIARFKVMGQRRKLAKQGLPLLDEDLADQLASECEAEPREFTDRLRALEHCLGLLSEKERELIENRYFSDAHLETFAKQTGRPVTSLRVSLYRIRGALKKCITGQLTLYRTQA